MTTSGEITVESLMGFLSLDKKPPTVNAVPTATGGLGLITNNTRPDFHKQLQRKRKGTDYAARYQEEEDEAQFQPFHQSIQLPERGTNSLSQLSDIEEASYVGSSFPTVGELKKEEAASLYSNYYSTFNIQYNSKLKITQERDKIIRNIEAYQVLVIQGYTGCGKTTQIPQYILDRAASLGQYCNIIVTQPRRIAAVSIARRVCEERHWTLGSIVGYQVALDSRTSEDTRLCYVTTGVLLQKLINSKRMDMYTHIILDEVHERDQDTDFSLLLVRKLLRTNSPGVRVIMMSATIDNELFSQYFSMPLRGRMESAIVYQITGKHNLVTEFSLNQLHTLGPIPKLTLDYPELPEESMNLAYKLVMEFDKLERNEQGVAKDCSTYTRGAVLIFLPGFEEISRMQNKFTEKASEKKWWLLPLHSSITVEEQRRVFSSPQPQYRKIILSTNIAESSITVEDIIYVIDFCLTKQLVCDESTNYASLQLQWASKASCNQRKGRTGRIAPGRYYRMIPVGLFDHLADHSTPEMQRCPLVNTVLRVKQLNMGEPKALLALAPDPPKLSDIERAILVLKEVQALSATVNGRVSAVDGDLTFIGQVMAALPLDVRISKLIVLGHAFDCLENCIIIAACLSIQSFLAKPFAHRLEAYKSQFAWCRGTFSDCFAYLHAYHVWKGKHLNGEFQRTRGSPEEQWCRTNFIQMNKIKDVDKLVTEIKGRLKNLKIIAHTSSAPRTEDKAQDVLILKMVIAGAFYPNYFTRAELDEKEISKQLVNRDPLSTVVLSGLPPNEGILYAITIRDMFTACNTPVELDFEDSKCYVQFSKDIISQTNRIVPAVYTAIKMRLLRMPLQLRLFSEVDTARKLAQIQRIKTSSSKKKNIRTNRVTFTPTQNHISQVPLPAHGLPVVKLYITEVVECGHFWAQYCEQEFHQQLGFLQQTINMYNGANLHPISEELQPGLIVLAPHTTRNETSYCRAKITNVRDQVVEVFLIDYGVHKKLDDKSVLRELDAVNAPDLINTPAQAFECVLSEIRPSPLKSVTGVWSRLANTWFEKKVLGQKFEARVYSVVQNIVRLELEDKLPSGEPITINNYLINPLFYAEKAEESFASKQNHELREKLVALDSEEVSLSAIQDTPELVFYKAYEDVDELNPSQRRVNLRGPSSPLEVSYLGVTRVDKCRAAKIDQDSINSVALDAEPQEHHERMLVAGFVGLNPSAETIVVRNTTLMPSIRGLSALIGLIFAPTAEFRINKDHSQYIGAICGLGYNPATKEPIFPEHDIEIGFDVELNNADIQDINKLRKGLGILFKKNEEERLDCNTQHSNTIRNVLRENLLHILMKHHEPIQRTEFRKRHQWDLIPEENLIHAEYDNVEDIPDVFPLLQHIKMEENAFHKLIHSQLAELHANASRSNDYELNKCPLCGVITNTPLKLMMHLGEVAHKQREVEFFKVKG